MTRSSPSLSEIGIRQPPEVTIVVPLHRDGPVFRKCLDHIMKIEHSKYELTIVTDDLAVDLPRGVKHLRTGSDSPTPPGIKRDLALISTSARYLAFIDDDAYPRIDWLGNAIQHLEQNADLAAVGGPGLTPPDSSFREKISGAIYQSIFGSGPLRYRFLPRHARHVDDLPAYNLVVRRAALESVGGWSSDFYGGEDTKVCLELVAKGHELLYSPEVVVYHYRRKVPLQHMKQVANVGLHRGFFLKRFPQTSRRLIFVVPLAGVVILGVGVGSLLLSAKWVSWTVGGILVGYLLVALEALRREPLVISLVLPIFLIGHHLAYAFGFLRGLLTKELQR